VDRSKLVCSILSLTGFAALPCPSAAQVRKTPISQPSQAQVFQSHAVAGRPIVTSVSHNARWIGVQHAARPSLKAFMPLPAVASGAAVMVAPGSARQIHPGWGARRA
jgi:hypothetical protein